MSSAEMYKLLSGHVIIEEKLDGSLETNADMELQRSIHWEDLHIRHSIYYDKLPAFYICLDVSKRDPVGLVDHVLSPEHRNQYGITPPRIAEYLTSTPSNILRDIPSHLSQKSTFATDSPIEGIVIKNYEKQLFGKVVNIEFYKGIEEQGSYHDRRPQQFNRLERPYRVTLEHEHLGG